MDAAELVTLLSPEGLRLLDSLPHYDSTADVVHTVSVLRAAGHSPELVAAVLTQSRLRRRAATKFDDFADRMLFTEAGLEQATRLSVAALHAQRFRSNGLRRIVDLGCGIGGDALAMAALDLEVTGVERDEVTAALAAYNLAPWANAEVVNASADSIRVEEYDGAWLDPARRVTASGHTIRRSRNPEDWSPSLDDAFAIAGRVPTGIKLGPGIDRDLIPAGCEAQWISVDGDVVELVLWFGALARPGIRRVATVIAGTTRAELAAAEDSVDADVGPLGEYLYEPDGAVIRARLIGQLVRDLGGRMASDGIAWFTADTASATPFATCFRVTDSLPFDVKRLAKLVAARRIGTLEIKKRGVDVDPAALRKTLSPKGPNAATLILTRVAGKRMALLAERS
ncbi:SAM-dependent methyltransferase [Cryobacterium mesophilum]|uniref:Class I SAM-dependent methyltransferase n=1 Tax=Terrimesophilobacter mesophilus TaxID=433647 RepID=A0A4R8VCV2_9MICO|nr:class I SAM-dependent methyltransferase [Terrimesophilobacter mesophilus]MBB5632882.1 SAM-dependent methyltransferase [Terrimesophilobacter mesophilus]TFB79657.1 class I SAM-dependent methyltransferase [Terrimesophilobacter mesophilus]